MARPGTNDLAEHHGPGSGISGLPDQQNRVIDFALPKTAPVFGIRRRAIDSRHLAPGSTVTEPLTCDQFGISRSPLREAILKLKSENLASVVANSGTCVAKIDVQSVFDVHVNGR